MSSEAVAPPASVVSVVVPCFNEQDVLPLTHRRLIETLAAIEPLGVEIVYVDDGSSDATGSVLSGLAAADPRVRVVRFSRNFGHQIAITAGIAHASGDAIVVIDADLQDPPELIVEMVDRWRKGDDVVYAVRTEREGESALKLATASAFYRLLSRLSDTPVPLDAGDFRLIDRRVAEAFLAMPEQDRYVRGMVSWIGFRQSAVEYRRSSRAAGETKYPLRKMVRFAIDGVVSFSSAPLRLSTWLGMIAFVLAVAGIVYSFVEWVLGDTVPGWTTLWVAVLLLGAMQLLSLGVMGAYVSRIYREVKSRPLYVVAERIGFPDPPPAATTQPRVRSANEQGAAERSP